MQSFLLLLLGTLLLLLLSLPRSVLSIRFVLDREECFSHNVEYDGDTVHVSFVVIKPDVAWHYEEVFVDLIVEGPGHRREVLKQSQDKFEFVAHRRGLYKFCFRNKSPYHETLDFDVHVGHVPYHEEHAKDDHFDPLMIQIARLEEAVYSVQFEQHWLQAQTDRQALLNQKLSKRVIHKALFESGVLIAASLLQVYLLRRLFEKKLSNSRV